MSRFYTAHRRYRDEPAVRAGGAGALPLRRRRQGVGEFSSLTAERLDLEDSLPPVMSAAQIHGRLQRGDQAVKRLVFCVGVHDLMECVQNDRSPVAELQSLPSTGGGLISVAIFARSVWLFLESALHSVMRRPDLTLLGSDACYKLDAPGLSQGAKAVVAAVFDPGLLAEADVFVARYRATHRHWSARKPAPSKNAKAWRPVLESTTAQDNAALNHLILRLEGLKPGDRRERELIEAMMIHLDGPVGFRVQLALAKIRPAWAEKGDLSHFPVEDLVCALSSCLSTKRGQQADGELLFFVAQLATLYERAGRRVTHSDQKAGEHLSAPQSDFGRLFETIVHDIDPSIPSSRLSRVLKALIKARGSAAAGKKKPVHASSDAPAEGRDHRRLRPAPRNPVQGGQAPPWFKE